MKHSESEILIDALGSGFIYAMDNQGVLHKIENPDTLKLILHAIGYRWVAMADRLPHGHEREIAICNYDSQTVGTVTYVHLRMANNPSRFDYTHWREMMPLPQRPAQARCEDNS